MVVASAVLALALPMVKQLEGRRLVAYYDIAGVPTGCDGQTEGVQIGDRWTAAECDRWTADELAAYEKRIRGCLPEVMPDKTRAAFVVTAWNIGTGGFCASSMSRRALAGDLRGACEALTMWTKARVHGRLQVVKGLVNRRAAERRLCLEGLA